MLSTELPTSYSQDYPQLVDNLAGNHGNPGQNGLFLQFVRQFGQLPFQVGVGFLVVGDLVAGVEHRCMIPADETFPDPG